jgi:hypothetical protein
VDDQTLAAPSAATTGGVASWWTRLPARRVGPARSPLAWRSLLLLALAGTALGVGICLWNLHQTEAVYGGLVHTGPHGPAAALLRRELPSDHQFALGEHDGPMYYAIARDPFHLHQVSQYLDRPRYRLQHPLLSWLAWAAHPWGGGDAMVWTLFGVSVVAIFMGSVAAGALSSTLKGPLWPALAFGVMPGAIISLRITTGDALGAALLLVALAASFRGHLVLTAVAAAAAVLAKEPVLLGLVGVALWRRDRDGLALVVPPVVVAGLWYVWLRIQLGSGGEGIVEFGLPFVGLARSLPIWRAGDANLAAVSVIGTFVLAGVALARHGWRHPLGLALILQLVVAVCYSASVIGLDRNATRMTLPVMAVALIMLVTPRATKALQLPASASTTGASASSASTLRPT